MTLVNIDPTILEECQLCMHVDRVENMLCDSYIIEFSCDPTCNYYERGKYSCRNFHVTKLPLFMLRLLSSLSSSLHMLVFACLDLFDYKIPMHRKYVRIICVCHVFYDALFVLQFLSFMRTSSKFSMPSYKALKEKRLLGGNPILFLFFAFCSCLVISNSSRFCLDVVLCFN